MRKVDEQRWARYFEARNNGEGVAASAKKARISESTAYRFERGDQSSEGLEAAAKLGISIVAGNLVTQPLSPEAKEALDNFALFRRRYFGRESTPWQERAAYEMLRSCESGDREYIVMNEPPGSGKSTLFTHDVLVWLIVRNRSLRIMIGSRTERQARQYVARIKRTLERDAPARASADDLEEGIAFDAVACLQDDYGAFRPEGRSELWRAEGLVVRQVDGVSADDKEPTVSAWGQDSGFLGGRFDLVVWDDLVDRKNSKTRESREQMREWWDAEAETRLEPRGTLLLQGQRITTEDLYRYCLDKENLDGTARYRHVVYRAHDDDMCTGEHDSITRAWPESCLLDPWRLPWRELEAKKHNNPRAFEVQYQQRDGDVPGGLAEMEWIQGGIDSDGYNAPGCLDKDRTILDPPVHLIDREHWSFLSVDPSPTEFWGVIWWLYDPDTESYNIIDVHRRRMNPEQFITWDYRSQQFSGLLVGMQQDAARLGIPLTHGIFETNAAQRWFLSTPHVQQHMATTGFTWMPHGTYANKNDPKYGLESIGDLYRQGRIRIPWSGIATRNRMSIIIDEVTRYPDYDTNDTAMSTWFAKLGVENNYTPRNQRVYRQSRPSWMRPAARRGLAYA